MTINTIKMLLVPTFIAMFVGQYAGAVSYPNVQTNYPYNLQDDSATLSGNVFDLGGDNFATVWFQYGTNQNYSYATNHMTLNGTGSFNQNVSGLYANTTYHVRAVAQNRYGINYGQDQIFTTNSFNNGNSNNLTVQTNGATNVYDTQASLNGYISGGSYNTQVWFQYGSTQSYGYVTDTQQMNYSGSVSMNVYNLQPNTNYHYRMIALDTNGQKIYGQDIAFYTSSNGNGGNGNNSGGLPTGSTRSLILTEIQQMITLLTQILSQLNY